MGIRFHCPACSKKVHVKDRSAGLRGYCPKCGAAIDVPLVSTRLSKRERAAGKTLDEVAVPPAPWGRLLSVAADDPSDPLDETSAAMWYVAADSEVGEPLGPFDADEIRRRLAACAIDARTMIWRQDWPAWRRAGAVWWQLQLVDADESTPTDDERDEPNISASEEDENLC